MRAVLNNTKALLIPLYQLGRRRLYLPARRAALAVCRKLLRRAVIRVRTGGSFHRGILLRGAYAFWPWVEHEDAFFSDQPLRGIVVYDVGAHIGRHTVAFARAVGPEGRVAAFEANPQTAAALHDTLMLNGVRNVWLGALGVSESACETTMVVPIASVGEATIDDYLGESLRRARKVKSIRVRCDSLDNHQKRYNLPMPDMVKMDVEGAEYAVLAGMRGILRAAHPDLYIEMHGVTLEDRHERARAIVGLLFEHGYSVKHVESGEPVRPDSFFSWRGGHLWATHSGS